MNLVKPMFIVAARKPTWAMARRGYEQQRPPGLKGERHEH